MSVTLKGWCTWMSLWSLMIDFFMLINVVPLVSPDSSSLASKSSSKASKNKSPLSNERALDIRGEGA